MTIKLKHAIVRFRKDEKGAALIEYSVLIGIITATVIGLVIVVGDWVNTQWSALNAELN